MLFGPPAWRPAAVLGAAVLAAALSPLTLVLLAPAAVLVAISIRDWATRPALMLSDEGLRYANGLGHAFTTWELVETVRVRQERHFLAFGRNLEIDLRDDTLIVLSQFQLAAPVDGVAAAVEDAWRRSAHPPVELRDGGGTQQRRDDQ